MRATIKDIAERVGVSKSLVSMYLNNHPLAERIAEKTKKKIDAAVREMDYQPSATARALVNGKSRTIGLIIGEIAGVYASFYSEALLREVEKYDYQLLISITQYNQEKERKCLLNMINRQADGILYNLYIDPKTPVPAFLKNYPILMTAQRDSEFNSLTMDASGTTEKLNQTLKQAGCHRIFNTRIDFGQDWKQFENECRNLSFDITTRDLSEFRTNAELLEACRREKADVLLFGGSTKTANFLRELQNEKDLPYILYDYTLPYDYIQHPRILGAFVNPFKKYVPLRVKRMIEMIEHPEEKIRHIQIPSEFMNPDELSHYYAEQAEDPYYEVIVTERGNILKQQKGSGK